MPSLFDERSPEAWASHITVPVFLVGALEDEQVGPQWPALITALQHDKNVYTTMTNGTHTDSLGPDTISRWLEFLDIYVAGRVPSPSPTLDALAPLLYATLTNGAKSAAVPAVRFTTEPSLAAAKAAYSKNDPRVRVLFDNGGGGLGPGALQPTYEAGFHVVAAPWHRRALQPRPQWHARLGDRGRRVDGGLPPQPGRPACR